MADGVRPSWRRSRRLRLRYRVGRRPFVSLARSIDFPAPATPNPRDPPAPPARNPPRATGGGEGPLCEKSPTFVAAAAAPRLRRGPLLRP